jgi:hypothetical protein
MSATVSGLIFTLPHATATRCDGALSDMSTIFALPSLSKWEKSTMPAVFQMNFVW